MVLTAPPSTWTALRIQPSLPTSYRMSTGTALKVLCRVDQPFWQTNTLQADSLSDQAVGMTWQGGEPATANAQGPSCLTVFAGGQAAQSWIGLPPSERKALANRELETLFPGFRQHNDRQMFCVWPEDRWTRCGYSAPALGEVTRVFPRLEQGWQGKLFFAGEYTSPGFYGYMEGGLHSGAVLARRLARQLNLLPAG